MNSAWLQGLALVSVGLALLGLCAYALVRAWRRDPITSYRMLVWVAAAALLIPLVQGFVQGRAAAPPASTEVVESTPTPRLDIVPTARPNPASPGPRLLRPTQPLSMGVLRTSPPELHGSPEVPVENEGSEDAGPSFPWLSALAITYLIGLIATLVWQGLRLLRTLRLLGRCRPAEHPAIVDTWNDVCADSALRERVRLLESDEIASPACWGFGRPVLVVPKGAGDRAHRNALQCALTHELIHLERGDARVSALQALIRILFWFHPAIWWLCRELDQLREISCDLLVVRRTGRAKSYALALLDYAFGNSAEDLEVDAPGRDTGRSRRAMRAACPSLLHWTRSPSQLRTRIEMLAMNQSTPSKRTGKARWLLAGGLLCTLGASQLAVAASNLSPFRSATASKATPSVALAEIPLLGPFLEAAWKLQGETTAQLDDEELAQLLADIERLEAELAEKVDVSVALEAARDKAAEAARASVSHEALSHLASLGYVGDVDTQVDVNVQGITESAREVLSTLGYVGDVNTDVRVNVHEAHDSAMQALLRATEVQQDTGSEAKTDAKGRFAFRTSPNVVVEGRVVDDQGRTLPGAEVIVEGSHGKTLHSFTTQTSPNNARTYFLTEDGEVHEMHSGGADGDGDRRVFTTTMGGQPVQIELQGEGPGEGHRIFSIGGGQEGNGQARRFLLNRSGEWQADGQDVPARLRNRLSHGIIVQRNGEARSGNRDELMERLDEVIERLERLEKRIDGLSGGSSRGIQRSNPFGRLRFRGSSDGKGGVHHFFGHLEDDEDGQTRHRRFVAPSFGRNGAGGRLFFREGGEGHTPQHFEWHSHDGDSDDDGERSPTIWFSHGDGDGDEPHVYSWSSDGSEGGTVHFGLMQGGDDHLKRFHFGQGGELDLEKLQRHFEGAEGAMKNGVYFFETPDGVQGKVRIDRDHDHGEDHDHDHEWLHRDHDADHGERQKGAVRYELRDMAPGAYRLRLRGEDGDGQILRLGDGADIKDGQLFDAEALLEFEYEGEIDAEDIEVEVELIEDADLDTDGIGALGLFLGDHGLSRIELQDLDVELQDLDIQIHGLDLPGEHEFEILGGGLEDLHELLEGHDLQLLGGSGVELQTEGILELLGDGKAHHGILLHGRQQNDDGHGDVRIQTLIEGVEGLEHLDSGILELLGDVNVQVESGDSDLKVLPLTGGIGDLKVDLLRSLGDLNGTIGIELRGEAEGEGESRRVLGNRVLRGLEIHPEVEGKNIRLEIRTQGDDEPEADDEEELIEFALGSSTV